MLIVLVVQLFANYVESFSSFRPVPNTAAPLQDDKTLSEIGAIALAVFGHA